MHEKPVISIARGQHRIADPATFDLHDFASSRGLNYSQALGLVGRFAPESIVWSARR